MMKLDILAFAAHPDDVELSCSGTVIKHLRSGKKIGIVDLTRGELGTRGNPDLRQEESRRASEVMGLTIRENLGMPDGFFDQSETNKRKVIEVIRKYRPDIILANSIEDRHPDHAKAAKLVADASFLSGLVRIVTELNGVVQESWRPRALYHYIQDYQLKPDFVVDITGFIEPRMQSILAYSSQFYNPDSTEPMTPISGKDFIEINLHRCKEMGRLIGTEYGEGFIASRPVGVGMLNDLI